MAYREDTHFRRPEHNYIPGPRLMIQEPDYQTIDSCFTMRVQFCGVWFSRNIPDGLHWKEVSASCLLLAGSSILEKDVT